MITKLSLIERAYLSPGAMAAAHQQSYLILHSKTPWCRIALKAFVVIILIGVCVKWITR
jgi:hypothetical protein